MSEIGAYTCTRTCLREVSFEFERYFLQKKSAILSLKLQHQFLRELDTQFSVLDEQMLVVQAKLLL